MTTPFRFIVPIFALLFVRTLSCQEIDPYVDGLDVKGITPTTARLTWKPVASVPCEFTISYSVYRDTNENFEPSAENLIVAGLTKASYIAHEKPKTTYYYYVKADRATVHCAAPNLHTGPMLVFPLDLGARYPVNVGEKSETCRASSTLELTCETLPSFHAVTALQDSHEYLIGCLEGEYETGGWSCVNLTVGTYRIIAHNQTLTVVDSGFYKIDIKTGTKRGEIIPVFSILARLK